MLTELATMDTDAKPVSHPHPAHPNALPSGLRRTHAPH